LAGCDDVPAVRLGFGCEGDPQAGAGAASCWQDASLDPAVDAVLAGAQAGRGFTDGVLVVVAGLGGDVVVLVAGVAGALAAGGFDLGREGDGVVAGGSAAGCEVAVGDPVPDGLG
jgi:hypothetical protein